MTLLRYLLRQDFEGQESYGGQMDDRYARTMDEKAELLAVLMEKRKL